MEESLRRAVVIVTSVMVVGLAALAATLAAAPTLFTWASGRYERRQIFHSASPDGRYQIVGTLRADFPANDILDPSATLRITLTDERSGNVLDEYFVSLYEYGDFNDHPKAAWQTDGSVRISNIDDSEHDLSVTLNARRPQYR